MLNTVWLTWWNNGLSYDDNYIALVGVYSTREKAERAGKRYHKKNSQYPWYKDASWEVEEVIIDGKYPSQFG